MKSSIKHAVIFIMFGCILSSCDTATDEPATANIPKTVIIIDTIPYASLTITGGPGYYRKKVFLSNWPSPTWGDSLLKVLTDSNLVVNELWVPFTPSVCLDPLNHDQEVVKLNTVDTSIYRFGYARLDTGKNDLYCIREWKYYKITRTN